MFMCFKRRHYNKSPPVWISDYIHWRENGPLITLDEYPVENCHSIFKQETELYGSSSTIICKGKYHFCNKLRQANFSYP